MISSTFVPLSLTVELVAAVCATAMAMAVVWTQLIPSILLCICSILLLSLLLPNADGIFSPSHSALPLKERLFAWHPDEDLSCGSAWQKSYGDFYSSRRPQKNSDSISFSSHEGSSSPTDVKYLTFTCIPGKCGGIGDLFIGFVSAFVVALMQNRILVLDYPFMEAAFLPSHIDWRLGPDVPMDPHRAYPPGRQARREEWEVKEGEVLYVNLHNKDIPDDVEAFFQAMEPARNIRLLWNRGLLVYLFSRAKSQLTWQKGSGGESDERAADISRRSLHEEVGSSGSGRVGEGGGGGTREGRGERGWGDRLREAGLRLPSAFGCILQFLIE